MESIIENVEHIISRLGDVTRTTVELWKLKTADKIFQIMSSIISIAAIVLIVTIAILILSIGGALWIGHYLGDTSYGFFIVGGFYVLVLIVIVLLRKQLIITPFNNFLSNKILK
ncbi:MAG: hypothetical protein JWM28_218 [Chitinophagaceae bacterium]|nr:hypothetical protein [Chitinophagaceae bacterium]